MTWLLLALMWAIGSWYVSPMDELEIQEQLLIAYQEEQQKLKDEQIKQDKILNDIFVGWFIDWLLTLWKIKYRLWHYDVDEKKFDCVGLFKGYAVSRWLLTQPEADYINSYVMYKLGKPKTLSEAKKWDVTFRMPLPWETLRHIAIISRDYNKNDGGVWIVDNAPWNGWKVEERFLQMWWDVFVGKWKIKIASNPFIEIANHKWLQYSWLREYEWYFNMTRYYAPVSWQSTYEPYSHSYEEALTMNCGWDCGKMAWKKTEYSDTNKVVSCPMEYKLGQILRIVDDSWYERLVKCADRWGAIHWKKLDLFAWIGEEWLQNMIQNKVPSWSQHVYKFNYEPKPKNEPTKTLHILNSDGDYSYF